MKVGIVLVTYSMIPKRLFKSIEGKAAHVCRWYIHHHGQDHNLIKPLQDISSRYDTRLYLHMFNRGLSRSWNDGIGESFADGNDFTLVINDDLEFIDDGFNQFIQFIISAGPDFCLAALHGKEGENHEVSTKVVNQGYGCFAIGQHAIDRIGFFDENIVPAYYEDVDYVLRMKKSGLKPVVDERVLVIHERSNSLRNVDPGTQTNLRKCKSLNRDYIIKKWGIDAPEAGDGYDHPFNKKEFDINISWENRHTPYGQGYDREDLSMLRTLMWRDDNHNLQKIGLPVDSDQRIAHNKARMTKRYYSGRAIFDHLQKTAGMAVDDWLVRHLGSGSVTPLLTGRLRDLIEAYGGNYPIISGHVLFDGTGLDPRYQYFTILRDPVDRFISWLHYVDKNMALDDDSLELKTGAQLFLRSDGEETTPTFLISVDNFYVNRFSSAIMGGAVMAGVQHNYFTHFIVPNATGQQKLNSALAVIAEYELVGFYEYLPQFIDQLADLLRLTTYTPLRAVNVTIDKPERNAISERMLYNILKLTEWDREFYSKAKELIHTPPMQPNISANIQPFERDFTAWNYALGSIRPYWRGAYMEHFLAKDLATKSGIVTGIALVSNAVKGYLCYGPYLRLDPGRYRAVATGVWITRGATCIVDVCSKRGTVVHGKCTLVDPGDNDVDWLLAVDFILNQEESDIEFRMEVPEDHQVLLGTVTILNQDKIHAMLGLETNSTATNGDLAQHGSGKIIILAAQMSSRTGLRIGQTLQTSSRDGFLCYGPYMALGRGTFRVELVGSIGPRGLAGAYVEVVCNSGKTTIHQQPLVIMPFNEYADSSIGQPWIFFLEHDVNDLEIRLRVNGQSEINLCYIVLQQVEEDR